MNILAGIHAVRHALMAGAALDEVFIEKGKRNPRLNELMRLAKAAGVRVSFVPREVLTRMAGGVPHQGTVARMAGGVASHPSSLEAWLNGLDMDAAPLVLILDGVTDPHNLGACIRTAAAAGCAGVVLPKRRSADIHSPVVAKAACGALSRLPLLIVPNLQRALREMQERGFWIAGLAGEAEGSLFEASLTGPLGLVLGAEEKGLRRLIREQCDQLLRIPLPGSVEALNVSVATGIALFEALRQRRQ